MNHSRRKFITNSSILSTSFLLSKNFHALAHSFSGPLSGPASWPISELSDFKGTSVIAGDAYNEGHAIFWDKRGLIASKGGLPSADVKTDYVIVGGGTSALVAAYYLLKQNKRVLILEGHPQLGGNARAEKFQNTYISQGAAYITKPVAGCDVDHFLKEINIAHRLKEVTNSQADITLNGKVMGGFWNGDSDPANRDQFRIVYEKLNDIYQNAYPEIPSDSENSPERLAFNLLDKIKFKDWVSTELPNIHPHILEYFHLYCWSSFGMSFDEISAAQALNFITCDIQGILALPGGNAQILTAVLEAIKNDRVEIVNSAFVVDIKQEDSGVYVCYYANNQKLKAISAKKCIVTSSKMVAKHMIDDLPKSQFEAMNKMRYHAYLVANIMLKKNVLAPGYDLYSLLEKIPQNEYEDSKKRVFTDIIFANWANQESASHQALTLYLPLPYDLAQQYLFHTNLYEKYQARIDTALMPFLNSMGIEQSDIAGLRLTRYGHALPLAVAGGIASGHFERAHAQVGDKIIFANQDNWGNPCFETAFAVAKKAALIT